MQEIQETLLRAATQAPLLEALPEAAFLLDLDRTIVAANSRFLDLFSTDTDVCGHSCFEICHGRNRPCAESGACPFDRCLSSGGVTRAVHVHDTPRGEAITAITMRPIKDPMDRSQGILVLVEPIDFASARASDRPILHGRSPLFRGMLDQLRRLAPTQEIVLIVGELGTEKEQTARAIHELSDRRARRFMVAECSALPEWQMDREVFGCEAGALPGMASTEAGLMGAAAGGTLLFREVDALPLSFQVKLLRVLDTGLYFPQGSIQPLRCDVRLICSARTDLTAQVRRGTFREDLRLRISSFPIRIPPLRERQEDIPLLVDTVLFGLRRHTGHRTVHPEALAMLRNYPFPGNLRELRSVIERASVTAGGGTIHPEHLPEAIRQEPKPNDDSLHFSGQVVPLKTAEKLYIRWAENQSGCSRAQLAERLGISNRTLYRKRSDFDD